MRKIIGGRLVVLEFSVFFFFQAEDGIRDLTVTGVQTCALPILWYARSRHSSIQGGSPFFWEISRMTSSERPGGTVSDSISVTKPYLYGWRTWASIPLLIGAPEGLCASQVAEIWPWRKRILQELLGIVNQAPGCTLVDVPVHLPDEALVILRRVEIVDDRRVVDRHGDEIRLMGGEHCPRAVPGGGRAVRELREDGLIPDHRLPALLGEARDDGGRPGPPVPLEQRSEERRVGEECRSRGSP